MSAPWYRPSLVMWKMPYCQRTLPGVVKIWTPIVKMMMTHKGFKDLRMNFTGRREMAKLKATKAVTRAYEAREWAKKMAMMKIIVATILMRGSSLCKKDVPGKYWPSVISVSMALASFQAVENSLCPFFDGPDPVVDGKAPSLEVLEHSRDGRHGYAGIVQGALLGRKDIQRFAVEDDMALGQDQQAAGQAGNIVHIMGD